MRTRHRPSCGQAAAASAAASRGYPIQTRNASPLASAPARRQRSSLLNPVRRLEGPPSSPSRPFAARNRARVRPPLRTRDGSLTRPAVSLRCTASRPRFGIHELDSWPGFLFAPQNTRATSPEAPREGAAGHTGALGRHPARSRKSAGIPFGPSSASPSSPANAKGPARRSVQGPWGAHEPRQRQGRRRARIRARKGRRTRTRVKLTAVRARSRGRATASQQPSGQR